MLRTDLFFSSPSDHFLAETSGQLLNFSDPVSSVGNVRIGLFSGLLGNVKAKRRLK